MGSSSEDASEISESEISSYKEKIYEELKTGKYKIKISNDIYKCPFCLGKKKQQYDYKSIMQHSSGIGKGSSNRRAKQKAHHLALAKYIETYLPNESKSFLKDKNEPGPTNSIVKLEPLTKPPQESDQYVLPWTGIIVNLPRPGDDDDDYLKKYYSRFSPLRVHILWNSRDRIGYAILDFSRDWAGFDNAIAFEKEFESKDQGKKHWKKRISNPGSSKYGWFARADDYHSEGLIGQHLRQYGELRTFTDITEEATKKTQTLVEFLTDEIAAKNEDIYKWQSRCDETSRSVMLMEEKDRLQRANNEEIKRLQRTSQSQMKNNELEMASMEQKKADENILRLIESQKREKEAAPNKILQLEKKLDAKQKLALEIEELKGNRQAMQHMGGEDDQKLQEQMKKIDEDLKDKMDEMEDLEAMNQTLLVKERKCSDELQEACKVLTEGLEKFKDVKDLDGKVLRGQTSLGTIVCAIIVPGVGIWLGCDSRSARVPDDISEHVVVKSDKSMKYQILRGPGKPPIVGMASGNSLRIKNLWKAIHTKVKDGSDTIGKVVNEVMLHLQSNLHAKHSCSVLLAGFYSEKECFVVVHMGDKRSIEFYPSHYGNDPQYQVFSGSGGKFAQKYLLKWMSERTTTDNINALKGKALKLIKSALIEAVTDDAGCGGNLNGRYW